MALLTTPRDPTHNVTAQDDGPPASHCLAKLGFSQKGKSKNRKRKEKEKPVLPYEDREENREKE